MQTQFFDFQTGAWPRAIDWTSAVLGTLLAATTSTLTTTDLELSNRYFGELVAFYYGQHSESLKRQAYDDILWGRVLWHPCGGELANNCSMFSSLELARGREND